MTEGLHHLTGGGVSLVIAAAPGERPRIVHWGARLASADALPPLTDRQPVFGLPDDDPPPSLSCEQGSGWPGTPGLACWRERGGWAPVLTVGTVAVGGAALTIRCQDDATAITGAYELRLDPETGILTASLILTNEGDEALSLGAAAPLCLPVPWASEVLALTGRWAGEFAESRVPLARGAYLREVRRGRHGHDGFPGLMLLAEGATETGGEAVGVTLGWSGDNRVLAERWPDGRAMVQLSELFAVPLTLAPGEAYRTPTLHAAWSGEGLAGVSDALHRHVRGVVMDGRAADRPRPVHCNSWEATYFDHDEGRLRALAERAAAVGCERFVLDDGWFGGRRHDRTGLGDWWVSRDVYPDGLGPLADHVRSLGMTFGLWFEPESVNPDSELYRAHPDWVLGLPGRAERPMRGQLTLDLTRPEVADHLFARMDAVIGETGADSVKWDVNRDTALPGSGGVHASGAQTRAVYALMDRLRAAHPTLEIEACASGGGRADYGVLARTDRVWISDSNDALDRRAIQRGAGRFLPLSVLGAHVGPDPCHVTGRRHGMAFRAGTAVFGHMGVECDLTALGEADLGTLAAAIALHKAHRGLIHEGRLVRLALPDEFDAFAVVARDRSAALVSVARLAWGPETHPPRLRLAGLDPARSYRLRLVWPEADPTRTAPSPVTAMDLLGEGLVVPGDALMAVGMQLPVIDPESCLIYSVGPQGGSTA